MQRRFAIVLCLVLAAAAPGLAQRPDRRQFRSDMTLAQRVCKQAADSGSVGEALRKLNALAARDNAYPGLQQLIQACGEEQTRQKNAEDLLFEDAKSAWERRVYDEARAKFQSLANRNTVHQATAKEYLLRISRQTPPAGAQSSRQDYQELERARRYFQANSYERAKPILQVLAARGGTAGDEAKLLLDSITTRERLATQVQQGARLIAQRRYQEALDILTTIQREDPQYPGLAGYISQAQTGLGRAPGTPASDPALERVRSLIHQKDYKNASSLVREYLATKPASAEAQALLQQAEAAAKEDARQGRVERFLEAGESYARRQQYARAVFQFQSALALAPADEEIQKLLAEAREGMKRSGQTQDAAERSLYLATVLESGLREFYAGNLAETGRLLRQYVDEDGKHRALACFFLGATASTEFFLGGANDAEKEKQAVDWFARGRAADARFEPPRDWVSPKIIALYDKGGSSPR